MYSENGMGCFQKPLGSWLLLMVLWGSGVTDLPAAPMVRMINNPSLASSLRQTAQDEAVQLEAVSLDSRTEPVALRLTRFRVFAEDAKVHIQSDMGVTVESPVIDIHFQGEVVGQPGSRVFLVVPEEGSMKGIIQIGGTIWVLDTPVLGPKKTLGMPYTQKLDPNVAFRHRSFSCATQHAKKPHITPQGLPSIGLSSGSQASVSASSTPYVARIAIETDFELTQLLGNTTAVQQYIGNLLGYISTIYQAEINVSFQIGDVFLYPTASDPWVQTGIDCMLNEFGDYWNKTQNRISVNRTVAHFISGKEFGEGGLAWLDVLCQSASGGFNTSASCSGMASSGRYGGDYGVSTGLEGTFNASNPQVVWDSVVVAHEIGHNFGSSHSHCYANVGGNGNDVDHCYGSEEGCYSGTTALPGLGSVTGGTPGAGNGTLMSYCHTQSPGMSNLSMTFGQRIGAAEHAFGVAPGRVPSLMRSTVDTAAANFPSCFSQATTAYPLTLFKDGTGSGTVTSNPTGINCGSTCSASFDSGKSVTLTVLATSGTFTGWSGDCSGTRICTVSMTAARNVTATFTLSPTVINGSCGLSHGQTFASAPTSGLCNTGTASAVSGSGPWNWTCGGSNGGSTVSCSANLVSTESVVTLITHYYQSILGRAPEPAGLTYYQDKIAKAQALGDVKPAFRQMGSDFFNSPEYLKKGTGNTAYVTTLYKTFLQRDPESAGLTYYLDLLKEGTATRNSLLDNFVNSPEFAKFMKNLGF